jgi:hypothetical protein
MLHGSASRQLGGCEWGEDTTSPTTPTRAEDMERATKQWAVEDALGTGVIQLTIAARHDLSRPRLIPHLHPVRSPIPFQTRRARQMVQARADPRGVCDRLFGLYEFLSAVYLSIPVSQSITRCSCWRGGIIVGGRRHSGS